MGRPSGVRDCKPGPGWSAALQREGRHHRPVSHTAVDGSDARIVVAVSGELPCSTEFAFSFSHGRHALCTTSFEDTLRVARFMMADRAEDAFSLPPTEGQFREYVRAHFWDEEKQAGGWSIGDVYCLIRRNPRWA